MIMSQYFKQNVWRKYHHYKCGLSLSYLCLPYFCNLKANLVAHMKELIRSLIYVLSTLDLVQWYQYRNWGSLFNHGLWRKKLISFRSDIDYIISGKDLELDLLQNFIGMLQASGILDTQSIRGLVVCAWMKACCFAHSKRHGNKVFGFDYKANVSYE